MTELGLVNKLDEPCGSVGSISLALLGSNCVGFYLRTSCVLMRNPAGEFWTPCRPSDAQIAPNGLGFAMSKHGQPNESDYETACRGLSSELGIDDAELRVIGKLGPMPERGLPYFSTIYLYESDGATPAPNPKHFASGEWLPSETLARRLRSGEPAQDLLLPALHLLRIVENKI